MQHINFEAEPKRRGRPRKYPYAKTAAELRQDQRERATEHKELDDNLHQRPIVGKVYGRKFGSKKIVAIRTEDQVLVVDYLDYEKTKNTEALLMFNRWALRNGVSIP